MYSLSAVKTATYESGVDEGRRQILADIAKIVHDNKNVDTTESETLIGEAVCEYLENEGYL